MSDERYIWKEPVVMLGLFLVIVGALVYASLGGLVEMERRWSTQEEYGYAYLIPFIVGFFIWQRKAQLQQIEFKYSWAGLVVLLLGLFITVLGTVSATHSIIQYGFIVSFIGAVYLFLGYEAFKVVLPPLLLLFLIVPLPAFLYSTLSSSLQIISSELGVWVIRLFGISVFLEGNVIDLGVYKLQVVEACSGLRYLFPLVSLSLIAAFIYKAAFWKRAIIVLSSIPITILMNSFRIGMIGVLVEYKGIEQAEGFLHDFEGWIIFMACTGLLILEMWLFARFGKSREKLGDLFSIEWPDDTPAGTTVKRRKVSTNHFIAVAVVVIAGILVGSIDNRDELIPDRESFAGFPSQISDWKGKTDRLESIYLDALKLDDYLLTSYINGDGERIDFYVAYYGSQRSGEAAHSPKSCLPGGGWQITKHTKEKIAGLDGRGGEGSVNRVIIKKGEYTQLVYYWFQQRGRIITNEYLVKWYLFWDAMTKQRTDGALVRLTVMLGPNQDISEADKRLKGFISEVAPLLPSYIPG